MDADIEHLVLSGKLFGTNSRSSSPSRSPSPTLSFASASSSSSSSHRRAQYQHQPDPNAHQESIGMGPGRTGVKGVIRDQHEAAALHAERRAREMEEVRRKMERGNLGGKTFLEEEAEDKKDALEFAIALGEKRDVLGLPKAGRFGHLREVGRAGFVGAVEREDRGVWVVVHLYESSLDRCYALDEVLARLARIYPETKFVRARAAALGFASAAPSSTTASRVRSRSDKMPGRFIDDDEEDPYADGADEKPYHDDDDDEGEQEDDVDTDMLPTLLVYRDGELVHNWVRVDWEAGQAGVEDLLARRNVISSSFRSTGNCGLPEDDGDDLIWSDEER
ncbi:thioredoxin-like protein [Suillus clintonianus]|uniref:thioredoxin-like protein n=1 Tax=Suillus clintonianus TaxID=1904413 RepID=UPI001B85DE8F|nr:thioredoxin-like protein [Suillus clintonianus]KAG2135147.1 thioredoxin-like protein [Suillus clintonianus]